MALIGCCLMLQPVSTDLYLASLPGLARTFAASIATVQLTLSVWVAAFGTDAARRRPAVRPARALSGARRRARPLRRGERRLRAGAVDRPADRRARLPGGRLLRRGRGRARRSSATCTTPQAGAQALAQASTILAIGPIARTDPRQLPRSAVRTSRRIRRRSRCSPALLLRDRWRSSAETNRHPDPAATRPRALAANYARRAALARVPAPTRWSAARRTAASSRSSRARRSC